MRRGSHIKRQLRPLISSIISGDPDDTPILPSITLPLGGPVSRPSSTPVPTSTSSTSSSSSTLSTSSPPSTSASSTTSSVSSTTPTSTPTPTPTPSTFETTPSSTVHTVTTSVDAAPAATSSGIPSPPKSFLQNKVASGIVFALVGIVGLFIILAIVRFVIKRRGKKKLMEEAISFDPNHHGAGDNQGSLEKWGTMTRGSEEHAPSLRDSKWNNHSQSYQHERKFFDPSLGNHSNLPPPRLYNPFDHAHGQTRTPF